MLDVVEDDGDFLEVRPRAPELDAQEELLRALTPELLARFEESMRTLYRDGVDGLDLDHGNVTSGGPWSSFGITASDGPWLWVGIRNLWTRAPRLWIDYYPLVDWRAKRRLAGAHRRIERLKFRQRGADYRFEEPTAELEGATAENHAQALEAVGGIFGELVRARVFDLEVERLRSGG